MLKQNWKFISRIERAGDILITLLAFHLAYHGRAALHYWNQVFSWGLDFEGAELAPIDHYYVLLLTAIIGYGVILNVLGAYGSMRLSSPWQLLRLFLISSFLVFLIMAAVLFTLKLDFSRAFVGIFCVLTVLLLSAERFLVLRLLRFARRKGYNFRNVVVCGTGEQALRVAREIALRPELGVRIRCFASLLDGDEGGQEALEQLKAGLREDKIPAGGPSICGKEALERAQKEYAIDEVIFTDFVQVMPRVEEMVLICSEQGVRTTLAGDLFSIGLVKSGISYFGGMPLIHFQTPPGDRWELAVKRGLDVVVSALLLLILWPFMLLIAVGIKLSSPGPVLFIQKRIGLNGRFFTMYKFRSMYVDAEGRLEELRELNEMKGPAFKMANDPRITSIGRVLRRFSLDELPQLWNVLRGEMSLVGPRPPVPGEVQAYHRRYRRRLSMRPGLTCTWQVSGRNQIDDFQSWVKLDLEYIDNWSLGRDFWLLCRTIPAVIFGTGAR